MAEHGGGIEIAEVSEVCPYSIPEVIPRDSLDFRIAQLEQLSRIRGDCLEAMGQVSSVDEIRDTAVAHAREAELSDWEIEGIKRVLDRWERYDANIAEAVGEAKREYFDLHPDVDQEAAKETPEYNRHLAQYLYKDLFEKEPEGNIGVIFHGLIGVCFVYDNEDDFPQTGNLRQGKVGAGGALLKSDMMGSRWEQSRMSRYRVLFFPTDNVSNDYDEMSGEVITEGRFAHEVDHDIRHILDEEFTEGYTDQRGAERLRGKYVDILNKSFRLDPDSGESTYDKHAMGLSMVVEKSYAAAKDELLADLAGLADYMGRKGVGVRIDAEKVAQELMDDYNFLGIDPSNNHYQRATGEMKEALVNAVKAFDHVAYDIYRSDFSLTAGILEMFDIVKWPVVARAIENKVNKYGLPAFRQ